MAVLRQPAVGSSSGCRCTHACLGVVSALQGLHVLHIAGGLGLRDELVHAVVQHLHRHDDAMQPSAGCLQRRSL